MRINSILYHVKIVYSLHQKTLSRSTDYAIYFIKLICSMNIQVSNSFNILLNKLQTGDCPEDILMKLVTPSEDFNKFIRTLINEDFQFSFDLKEKEENSIEKRFKVYIRQIESKLSLIFFIGLFLPLSFSLLILFQKLNPFLLFLALPVFFILMRMLYKNILNQNKFMVGILNDQTKHEKLKFQEFVLFIKGLASKLKKDIPPEKALLDTYIQLKDQFIILKDPLLNRISIMLNSQLSFGSTLNGLKLDLKSFRYDLILYVIEKITETDPYYSSNRINKLLELLNFQQNLETKLAIIIKGERFRVLTFLLLSPAIIGTLGGMFPFFIILFQNADIGITITNSIQTYAFLQNLVIVFICLLSCCFIVSFYFIKIVYQRNLYSLMFLSGLIYCLAFFISYFWFGFM